MSNQATNTAAAAAPAKAKKPSIVDTFLKGCAKGFKVGIENITPAMILGYVLVYILKETGLMDILGTVMSPVMGLFGLPGEAFAVLISAFFAKASGCATAASMYEAGALTLGQASMMLPACILMGTLIGHYARIVLVTDTNKKWHRCSSPSACLMRLSALSSCASFWRQWAFSKRRQSLCFPSYRVGAAFSSKRSAAC